MYFLFVYVFLGTYRDKGCVYIFLGGEYVCIYMSG